MKQKGWILLAVLLLLVAFTFVRERFEATPSIKAPPYNDADATRIFQMLSKADQDTLTAEFERMNPGSGRDGSRRASEGVAAFYLNVYSPAKTPITEAQIDQFLNRGTATEAEKPPMKRLLKMYFMNQSGVGTSVETGYATKLEEQGQLPGYLGAGLASSANPVTGGAPAGGVANPFEGTTMMPGGPSAGGPPAGATVVDGGPVTVLNGGPTPPATTTGTTTGGSSTTSLGPTSGTTGASGQRIFGPIFTGRGEGGNPGNGGDSTKTNTYPELLGGRGGAPPSTKVDGAGIVPPSKNWTLTTDGSLPPSCSLGTDPQSDFFVFSRCPGDMDLIPDPYRLSRNFSTASYSSKTEPAPFLTDFSAFLK